MNDIKILHVIARMNVGGTAHYVGNLVEKIPGSALVTGFVQNGEVEAPVASTLSIYRIHCLGRRISPKQDFRSWRELRKLIKEIQPEIVHTHTFKAGLIGRLIRGKHKRVHTFHGHLFGDQSFSTLEKLAIRISEKFLANRTDVLISVGEKVGSELRAAGIGSKAEWISIPPGVQNLKKIDKTAARKFLKLDPDAFLVGWMARMTQVKNPLLLLEVARCMPETKFIMAGGGDLLEKVKNSAPSNVSVLGWTNAAFFWSAIDCAISTSDNEGIPIALIEAQLSGIPVVATNVGSNSEVIASGITGLLAKNEADSLVSALKSVILDQELFASMGRNAEALTHDKFSVNRMLVKHLQMYSKLINPHSESK